MKLPKRRMLWIVCGCIAAVSLKKADLFVDAQGILRDSPLLPFGGVLAVVTVIIMVFDLLITNGVFQDPEP